MGLLTGVVVCEGLAVAREVWDEHARSIFKGKDALEPFYLVQREEDGTVRGETQSDRPTVHSREHDRKDPSTLQASV